jgi:hypothetical protein
MTERRFIELEQPLMRRRRCTRRLMQPWPFLFSVVGNEIVKNLPPEAEPSKPVRRKSVKQSTKKQRILIKTPL